MKKCPYCGKSIEDEAAFCLYCMRSLNEKTRITPNAVNARKNKIVFSLLFLLPVVIIVLCIALLNEGPKPKNDSESKETALISSEQTGDFGESAISDLGDDSSLAESSEPDEEKTDSSSKGEVSEKPLGSSGKNSSSSRKPSSSSSSGSSADSSDTSTGGSSGGISGSDEDEKDDNSTPSGSSSSKTSSDKSSSKTSSKTSSTSSTTNSEYTYKEVDGGISITAYNGNKTKITVPSSIDGKTVVGIADLDPTKYAGPNNLESVTLPDTLLFIEDYAFASMENVRYWHIPASVRYIGACVFAGSELNHDVYLYSTELTFHEDAFSHGNIPIEPGYIYWEWNLVVHAYENVAKQLSPYSAEWDTPIVVMK